MNFLFLDFARVCASCVLMRDSVFLHLLYFCTCPLHTRKLLVKAATATSKQQNRIVSIQVQPNCFTLIHSISVNRNKPHSSARDAIVDTAVFSTAVIELILQHISSWISNQKSTQFSSIQKHFFAASITAPRTTYSRHIENHRICPLVAPLSSIPPYLIPP